MSEYLRLGLDKRDMMDEEQEMIESYQEYLDSLCPEDSRLTYKEWREMIKNARSEQKMERKLNEMEE